MRLPPDAPAEADRGRIEARIAAETRAWRDGLRDAFESELGPGAGGALYARYADAFPGAYMDVFLGREGVADAKRIEGLAAEGDLTMTLYVPEGAPPGTLRLKVIRRGRPLLLTDVLPSLEDMGVRVADERPFEVTPAGGATAWIYDFGLEHDGGTGFEADRVRGAFQEALGRAWRGEAESDGFNRLVLTAELEPREIEVLRAIAKYLRQAGSTFSQAYMEDALAAHGIVARELVELFRLRLDPAQYEDTGLKADALTRKIEAAIEKVESLDEDRILRGFLRVVGAVLRTNWFQRGPDGAPKPYLSLKLDPSKIPDLPEPRPRFEVFVSSPRVEAVHLRGGKVARGGIRWSDRREDFRTEVLGLMKAQSVKNAVIVPVGAKGGFVVKRPPAGGDRKALLEEVVACYREFMRGLLDLTDTLGPGGAVVPPPDVVRHDEDDPYLVVAADKGTATFSDIANAVAEEYGFWLGDAFASGGSSGYDHKKMGITARGAWESVKRHFRELGVDVEAEPITAVGVGDMSGDVFGNGMLLSRNLKLVAAFDHRHVFLDPDPDPARSFEERRRLFELPVSSWADYDETLISKGGGVFPRSAKSVKLSPETRAALDVKAETLPPSELIRAILRAPVDLLWNGGIGTYVKAAHERDAEVGDKANDAVRVDGEELRARVVGEGGNLGFTQSGRVAYALAGGRIFMDAIDNSAGVDCSDHEVNIKILLAGLVAEGALDLDGRNALLAEMEDEVAALVLRDNYEQAQALSTAVAQAGSMAEVHERYLRALETAGELDRELEFLPDDETLAARRTAGGGLVAPEFAILLSYTKVGLTDALLRSDLPDEPFFAAELERYFPAAIRERFGAELQRHPLRREIVASQVANDLVNRAGTTFAFRLADETGASAADIARAFAVARRVFGLRALREEIHALDGSVPADVQTAMILKARILLERSTRWVLRHRRRPLDVQATIDRFSEPAAKLTEAVPGLLGPGGVEASRAIADELAEAGVPEPLARRVAHLEALVPTLDLAEIAAASGLDVVQVARIYFELGDRLELDWLRDRILALPRSSRWEAMARAALRDDVYAEQAAVTAEVVTTCPEGDAAERVEQWLGEHEAAAARSLRVLSDIRTGGTHDLARLSVAVRELRNLIASSGASGPAGR